LYEDVEFGFEACDHGAGEELREGDAADTMEIVGNSAEACLTKTGVVLVEIHLEGTAVNER
jgi:hypothetical protein